MIKRDKTTVIREIKRLYSVERLRIEARLAEFRRLWQTGSEEDIFAELAFCLFTPQSKARLCWQTVQTLFQKDLLLENNSVRIAKELNLVRFKNNKARYLVEARTLFASNGSVALRPCLARFGDAADARDWLVRNVKGLGLKEAAHFLRNIGRGEQLAILDRHILRNLCTLGVIDEIPASLTAKKYFDIEKKMQAFSERIKIPPAHLDLLLWCRETGEVFK
jgi:N-glycosylase/DNA lyase